MKEARNKGRPAPSGDPPGEFRDDPPPADYPRYPAGDVPEEVVPIDPFETDD